MGLLVAALGSTLTALASGAFTSAVDRAAKWIRKEQPLTVDVSTAFRQLGTEAESPNSISGWLIPKPIESLSYPSDADLWGNEGWDNWARQQGGVPAGVTSVELVVQGRSAPAVTLLGLRVKVLERRPPPSGVRIALSAGSGLPVRHLDVDLDSNPPGVSYNTDPDAQGESAAPPITFPYRVTDADPEVIHIDAQTSACDCSWVAELDWTYQGQRGTTLIDDHGKPFRTAATRATTPFYIASDGKFVRAN